MFTAEYFENLLERIERIRKSDRLFYQKVGDIFSTAFDYNPDSELAFSFEDYIEGKLFFAMHRKSKENQYIKPCEVSLYLTEDEQKGLNDIVELYLDYAKRQAEESIPMLTYMLLRLTKNSMNIVTSFPVSATRATVCSVPNNGLHR